MSVLIDYAVALGILCLIVAGGYDFLLTGDPTIAIAMLVASYNIGKQQYFAVEG
jgi:hypothetical protein